jgi:hypothetical protein
MKSKTETHLIDRSYDCCIIPSALDKPIELWMHHFHSMALIVNQETGDICTQFFSDSVNNFYKYPLRKLKQDVFLEQEGDKVVFLFNTNYDGGQDISKYISDLEKRGVAIGGRVTAEVTSFPNYNERKNGEIAVGFKIDLKNPELINIFGSDNHESTPFKQDVLKSVGNEKSTLPDINALAEEFYLKRNIIQKIFFANKNLPAVVEKIAFDLKSIGDLGDKVGLAVLDDIKKDEPFSDKSLYDDEILRHDSEKYSVNRLNRFAVSDMLSFFRELREDRQSEVRSAIEKSFPGYKCPDTFTNYDFEDNNFSKFIIKTCGVHEDPLENFIQAVKKNLPDNHPFKSYNTRNLNDDASIDQIVSTLTFVLDNGLQPTVVAKLSGEAAMQSATRLSRLEPEDDDYKKILSHSLKLIDFAKNIIEKQPDEIEKFNCAEQMRVGYTLLCRVLSRTNKNFKQLDLPERPALPSGVGENGRDENLGQSIDQNKYKGI